MRRTQDVAIALFERDGFGSVTVDEVAKAADVGVASVFRHFGTKEALVLWDEYDPGLLRAVEGQLRAKKRPLDAVLAALVEQLGTVYATDKRRILRRADLIAKTPELARAARLGLHELREEFERVLKPLISNRLQRALVSAVLVSTLEVTVEEWRRLRARSSLQALLKRSFTMVARLSSGGFSRARPTPSLNLATAPW